MISLAKRPIVHVVSIFCLGLILFTIGLQSQEIIGFESRFYLFAKEMWQQGLAWFPTTYHQAYPDYPATTTILIYWVSKCLGGLNKLTAVLPSASAAAMTMVWTYLIGALYHWRWGLMAVFFMLLTNTFLMEARTISPDQYIAMVTAACFYLAMSANIFQKSKRLYFIPVLLLFGFACRGPIGLVVPAGVLFVFYAIDREGKKLIIFCLVALMTLILACAILLGAAYHVGGQAMMQAVWQMEVSGRLQDADLPWYFYFVESIGAYALAYPLAILVIIGVGLRETDKEKIIQKLLGWMLIILIGLSIPAGKKIRYVLAMTPAIALMSAYLFIHPWENKYLIVLRKIVFWLCDCLPLLLCLAVTFILPKQFWADIFYMKVILIFLFLQLLCLISRKNEMIVLGVSALTFVLSYILIVEPINLKLNHTKDFVTTVELARHQQHAALVFYHESPDAMPIKYVVNMSTDEMPVFIENPEQLAQFKAPAFFVTDLEYYSKIPISILKTIKIIATGRIGHDPVVVFSVG